MAIPKSILYQEAVESRIAIQGMYLLGNEDMVLITDDGGVSLTHFPKTPLEL